MTDNNKVIPFFSDRPKCKCISNWYESEKTSIPWYQGTKCCENNRCVCRRKKKITVKSCTEDWTLIAKEDEICKFEINVDLKFGNNNNYSYIHYTTGELKLTKELFNYNFANNENYIWYRCPGIRNVENCDSNWDLIANENQTINFTHFVDLKYGGEDNFKYLYHVTGNVTFNDQTFGFNNNNILKKGYHRCTFSINQCSQDWTQVNVAEFNQIIEFTIPVDLRYGNSNYTYLYNKIGLISVNDTTFNNNTNVGQLQSLFYRCPLTINTCSPNWQIIAEYGQLVNFNVPVDVRLGIDPIYKYLYNVTGSIIFDDATFQDTIVNSSKQGWYRCQTPIIPTTCTNTWTFIGYQGSSVNFPIRVDLRYGTNSGPYTYLYNVIGLVNFNNTTFSGSGNGNIVWYRCGTTPSALFPIITHDQNNVVLGNWQRSPWIIETRNPYVTNNIPFPIQPTIPLPRNAMINHVTNSWPSYGEAHNTSVSVSSAQNYLLTGTYEYMFSFDLSLFHLPTISLNITYGSIVGSPFLREINVNDVNFFSSNLNTSSFPMFTLNPTNANFLPGNNIIRFVVFTPHTLGIYNLPYGPHSVNLRMSGTGYKK